MAQSQFSLLWNAHKNNICNGLSTLQQNGEFVDMTLAADGHLVKVHQLIVALASPYIKDLLSSAQCPHPVIFLNKISYTTLCSILEYVYTGEVIVSIENLNELLEAGKELHIKGLEDMKLAESITVNQRVQNEEADCNMESLDEEISFFEVTSVNENVDPKSEIKYMSKIDEENDNNTTILSAVEDPTYEEIEDESYSMSGDVITEMRTINENKVVANKEEDTNYTAMQYTVSNQGSLQMILNRYLYYLKHTNRNHMRQWRCVDYLNSVKCPARVFTKDDVVIQRISAHVHSFHDKRILKKVRNGSVYAAVHDAEEQRKQKQIKKKEANDTQASNVNSE